MDIENIPFGIDFRDHIRSVLLGADVLLVVIGRSWAGADPSSGLRRILEDADPVRAELEVALERNMPLIPVLVDGAAMPGKADLPTSLERLAFLNAPEVRTGADFNAHMERLVAALDRILPAQSVPAAAAAAGGAKPGPPAVSDSEPLPGASGPPSWSNDLVLYFLVPLGLLLVAHHIIVNSLDLSEQYLRAVSFAVPFVFGFVRSRRGGRGIGSAFAFALALGLIGVAAMTTLEGLYSGQPIVPDGRADWWEDIEDVVTVALGFMVGHALASGLAGMRRGKARA